MCRLQLQPRRAAGPDDATTGKRGSESAAFWPLPAWLPLALLPLLPTSLYLNRGYTVWFHLLSLSYLLTRSPFVRKVLILQGADVCLTWYAAISYHWAVEGTFCHMLYRNMPGVMVEHMLIENATGVGDGGSIGSGSFYDGGGGSYIVLDSYSSYATRAASHVLDALAHPGLAYLFWRLHVRSGGSLRDVLSWPVIVFAWHLSRLWSLVHASYNTGVPKLWYYGHDVYRMNDLDTFLIAYIAEGLCFGAAIACRVRWDRRGDRSLSPLKEENVERHHCEGGSWGREDPTPGLVHSESATSAANLACRC